MDSLGLKENENTEERENAAEVRTHRWTSIVTALTDLWKNPKETRDFHMYSGTPPMMPTKYVTSLFSSLPSFSYAQSQKGSESLNLRTNFRGSSRFTPYLPPSIFLVFFYFFIKEKGFLFFSPCTILFRPRVVYVSSLFPFSFSPMRKSPTTDSVFRKPPLKKKKKHYVSTLNILFLLNEQ